MIGRPDPQGMGQALQGGPFLGEGSDRTELDVAGVLEAGGTRQGLEQSRFAAATVARHQQRSRSRVIQVEQDRQAVFS